MAFIAPDLAQAYAAFTTDVALRTRITTGLAVLAHAVLTELAAASTATQQTWARSALAAPRRYAEAAGWIVCASRTYATAGAGMTDADILTLLLTHLDVLAAATPAAS